jgi:hypothetical protein
MPFREKEIPSISEKFFACPTDVGQALNRNDFGTEIFASCVI